MKETVSQEPVRTEEPETAAEKKPREKAETREPVFVKELKREKTVRVKIPVDKLNKADTFVPVCINGYIYQVARGEYVEVPQTVAALLEQGGYL